MATADNLFNMSQNFFTPEILQKLSRTVGLPVEKIQSSLKSILPTFLLGLANKGSTQEGAQSIVNLVKKEGFENGTPALSETSYLQKGNEAVHGIFGNNLSSVTSSLTSTTGLNPNSITKMMGAIAPVVMGFLGLKIKREGLSASALMNFLGQQKSNLRGLVPAGIMGFFGGSASPLSPAANSFNEKLKPGTYVTKEGVVPVYTDRKKPWALLALIAFAILAFLWWFTGQRNTETVSTTATTISPQEFLVPASSLGHLGNFLKTGDESLLPKRFAFENLVFDTGTSNIDINAQGELDLIAAMMLEYPAATARIEGFTDNVGTGKANLDLSKERANEVRNQLINRGVPASRIEAIGRGSEAPLASNDSDEGRAQNRRIEFVITNLK